MSIVAFSENRLKSNLKLCVCLFGVHNEKKGMRSPNVNNTFREPIA